MFLFQTLLPLTNEEQFDEAEAALQEETVSRNSRVKDEGHMEKRKKEKEREYILFHLPLPTPLFLDPQVVGGFLLFFY